MDVVNHGKRKEQQIKKYITVPQFGRKYSQESEAAMHFRGKKEDEGLHNVQ